MLVCSTVTHGGKWGYFVQGHEGYSSYILMLSCEHNCLERKFTAPTIDAQGLFRQSHIVADCKLWHQANGSQAYYKLTRK